MLQTLTVTLHPLAVEALQNPDATKRHAAWSELTLVAASAMAEVHAGLPRWMTESLGLSAEAVRALIGDAMSQLDPVERDARRVGHAAVRGRRDEPSLTLLGNSYAVAFLVTVRSFAT